MKFYYSCPRCGRVWRKFLPRKKMRCPFCEQEWHTKGRSGTKMRFSFTATLVWLLLIALIWFGGRYLLSGESEAEPIRRQTVNSVQVTDVETGDVSIPKIEQEESAESVVPEQSENPSNQTVGGNEGFNIELDSGAE